MLTSNKGHKGRQTPIASAKAQAKAELSKRQGKKVLSMDKLLGYQGMTPDDHFLILSQNRGYAEICRIPGVGLTLLANNMLGQPTAEFSSFLQRYDPDWTVIATQFPATTVKQQTSLSQDYLRVEQQLVDCQAPKKRQMLQTRLRYIDEEIQIASAVERTLKNQEYLAVIFGPTIKELRERVLMLRQRHGQYVNFEPLSAERKITFLYSLNNMMDKKIQ